MTHIHKIKKQQYLSIQKEIRPHFPWPSTPNQNKRGTKDIPRNFLAIGYRNRKTAISKKNTTKWPGQKYWTRPPTESDGSQKAVPRRSSSPVAAEVAGGSATGRE